jgi:two-component system CheB/CheR fusion protein
LEKAQQIHDGAIIAKSEGPGRGSEFAVRLPAWEEPAARKSGPMGTLPRLARQSSRGPVVDDHQDRAEGLAKLLQLLGQDVQVTYNGPTALESARSHRPEIILLEIDLPGVDGSQVARQLRREDCKDSLIVAVSGDGMDEDRRRSNHAGCDQHLVQPVDDSVLMTLFASQPG